MHGNGGANSDYYHIHNNNNSSSSSTSGYDEIGMPSSSTSDYEYMSKNVGLAVNSLGTLAGKLSDRVLSLTTRSADDTSRSSSLYSPLALSSLEEDIPITATTPTATAPTVTGSITAASAGVIGSDGMSTGSMGMKSTNQQQQLQQGHSNNNSYNYNSKNYVVADDDDEKGEIKL
jgi:hypothetical protein